MKHVRHRYPPLPELNIVDSMTAIFSISRNIIKRGYDKDAAAPEISYDKAAFKQNDFNINNCRKKHPMPRMVFLLSFFK